MARKHAAITIWSQYVAARLAESAITVFDLDATLHLAAAIGRTASRLDRRHHERCRQNLRNAFPEWPAQRVEAITRASFEHLLKLVFEICYTPRMMHLDTWAHHARIVNLGSALEILNARQPCIVLTGHVGNWEVLGYILGVLGYDVNAIARPIDNPLINDWILSIRQRRGLRIITKWSATDRMMGVLRTGGVLGFIADQNAGDKGLFVPFFGQLASTYKSIGLLAMRKKVPVICGYAHRIGKLAETGAEHAEQVPLSLAPRADAPAGAEHGPTPSAQPSSADHRFEVGVVDVIRVEDWIDRRDPLYYITARYCRAIETMVRMRPEQYLWMHRRWKSRPRHEREGRAMPASLRRNLEALPWMTDELMDQVHHPPNPPSASA